MAKQIVLWRHGQTDYNLEGKIQGQSDIELNEVGLDQAGRSALSLMKLAPERIIASDLKRAQQTACQLAEPLKLPVGADRRLRERGFGQFEGLTAKEMRVGFPQLYAQWRESGECPAAGIESRAQVGLRVKAAILEAAAQIDGTLVVVSHGSALTQGLVSLLGLDPLTWQGVRGLDNCHWAVLLSSVRLPQWRLAAYNLGS